jgi:hypothetical protein
MADLTRDGLGTIRTTVRQTRPDGSAMFAPSHPALVQGRVRYVGDPVALVVAETRALGGTPPSWSPRLRGAAVGHLSTDRAVAIRDVARATFQLDTLPPGVSPGCTRPPL